MQLLQGKNLVDSVLEYSEAATKFFISKFVIFTNITVTCTMLPKVDSSKIISAFSYNQEKSFGFISD